MGLLSKLATNVPVKKAGDDVLLLHGMMLMCAADGVLQQGELNVLQAFFGTLPEFKQKNFQELIQESNRIISRFGGLKNSVRALGEIESEAVKKKLFVLAVDIAMSSGDIDQAEDDMLETMQRMLNIDDELARKCIQVLALKYAT